MVFLSSYSYLLCVCELPETLTANGQFPISGTAIEPLDGSYRIIGDFSIEQRLLTPRRPVMCARVP